jgi:AcrR family transcriptional regulator
MRARLLTAAEGIVVTQGPSALSVRSVAAAVDASTQAVYTLFASKAGMVDALAVRVYNLVTDAIDSAPVTADPVADLVEVGVRVLREVVQKHAALYRIAFLRMDLTFREGDEIQAARTRGHDRFRQRLERLEERGLLGARTPLQAMTEFNAVVEGFAVLSLRGPVLPVVPSEQEETIWRNGIGAMVAGWSALDTGPPPS